MIFSIVDLFKVDHRISNRSTFHVIGFKAGFCLLLKPSDLENSLSTQGGTAMWNEHARVMQERFLGLEFLFLILNSSLQNLLL